MSAHSVLREYYADPEVRRCLLEFLGGEHLNRLTCEYITADGDDESRRKPRSPSELPQCLDRGMEIGRSLWDHDSLVVHLDIEHVNFDCPGEAYLDPERCFALQTSVVRSAERILANCGIMPLHILSGRGHHFIWRVRRGSAVFSRMLILGRVGDSLRRLNARPHPPAAHPVDPELGAAFSGLGLVMEYVAGRIKELAAPQCPLPVELTAIEVGPSAHGRELISIDISEYGDPLHTRMTRVPFSVYLKPWQLRALSPEELRGLPAMFFVPLHEMDVRQGLRVMRHAGGMIDLAATVSMRIPDATEGMANLIAEYEASRLARFHDSFYADEFRGEGPPVNDASFLASLPGCARQILEHPNDLLLQPGRVRLLTRVLLGLEWDPRQIARLVGAKFEEDHEWGERWHEYDAALRAEFYVRIFAGLFAVEIDDLVDFNCQSAREEKVCPVAECPWNLAAFRQSALNRRSYD